MTDGYRVLVTGSREWDDWRTLTRALVEAAHGKPRPVTVVHGCARGADFLAAQAARWLGWEVEDHPADWGYGKSAGFIRNAEMVSLGADLCLAFYKQGAGNKGTDHCASQAEKAGIPVRRFTG